MKCVADCMAMEGKRYATVQHTIRVIHYANHKVNGHNYGVAWKPAIAAVRLATTQNAISEAMNVLCKRENKVRRCRRCQSFTYSLTFQVHTPYLQ